MLSKRIRAVTRRGQAFCGFRTTFGKRLFAAAVAIQLSVLAVPLSAHHSVAMFDETQEVVLQGSVRVMEWANPHVWIRLNVTDSQGNVIEWGIEASNPLDLQRQGWSGTTFQPDDNVTITVYPAKNGTRFGNFVRATLADGSVIGVPEPE